MKKINWPQKSTICLGRAVLLISFSSAILVGCGPVTNNNLQVDTALGKVVTGGQVLSPLGSQPVAGKWVADIPATSPLNTEGVAPFGTSYSFQGVTDPWLGVVVLDQWPTYLLTYNDRMPAYWDFQWEHPSYCVDASNPPYGLLPNPYVITGQVELPSLSAWSNPVQGFNCFINSPANPDFAPSEASPQFVLDDALPSTIQVHAFSPINAAAAITNLHLFSMSLTNPANVTAESVASDGSSAVFPYPLAADGMALPAGPYITTITTDPTGSPQTTNGMEPIYIAHDDKSYTSAFGVDVAAPQEEVITIQNGEGCNGAPPTVTNTIYGGKGLPLVTLPTLGKLAVGSSSQTISVGTFPTSVIAYNNQVVENTTGTVGNCQSETIKVYTGSQSALVVNTGSNNVSLVNIGEYAYPTGTIAVGSSPVAATINPSGTLAYIANYGSGTISEINLQTVQVTRTLSVTTHPTSVAFDSNGNLWVGGQGYLQLINITNWSAGTAFSVDGTVTGMSYDVAQGEFVCMMLQNGTPSAPSNGNTRNHVVAYSPAGGVSYSTASMVNVATGNTVVGSSIASDSAPYAVSSLAPALAYPGQTAFNPPIYTSSSGDLMASANGNTFTVSVLSTGKVLISGAVPHPIRGVKLTPTMLYFTMSESNSLVSLPIQLP